MAGESRREWPGGKEPGVVLGRGPRPFPIPDSQSPGNLALATSGESHQTVCVLGQERVAEARHRLGSGHVRPAHEAAEAAVSDRVPGQQDEVRATLTLPDATQILLHGVAVPRQAGPGRAWPGRQPLPAPRITGEWRRASPLASSLESGRRSPARDFAWPPATPRAVQGPPLPPDPGPPRPPIRSLPR